MEDETRDIQQDLLSDEAMEAWHEQYHPQDDLPTEVVLNYIVADYRRMYKAIDRYKALSELTAKQIEARAKEIAAPRKAETNELADLRLELDEKSRKIQDMYDWLAHKENMIAALRKHIDVHRQEVSSLQHSVTSQRYQIQSLLNHFDDKYKTMESCPEAWSSEMWRESVLGASTLYKQLAELKDVIGNMELDDSCRTILDNAVQIIRNQARRTLNRVNKIAIPALRKEFGTDIIGTDDDDEKEESDD